MVKSERLNVSVYGDVNPFLLTLGTITFPAPTLGQYWRVNSVGVESQLVYSLARVFLSFMLNGQPIGQVELPTPTAGTSLVRGGLDFGSPIEIHPNEMLAMRITAETGVSFVGTTNLQVGCTARGERIFD